MHPAPDPYGGYHTRPSSASTKIVIGVAAAAGIVIAWWIISGIDSFRPYPGTKLRNLLANAPGVHPIVATDELCNVPDCDPCHGHKPDCIEGWRTDVGSYLQFRSTGSAEYWAAVLGDDGRRDGNVVLAMHATNLTFAQRRYAIDMPFTSRDWS